MTSARVETSGKSPARADIIVTTSLVLVPCGASGPNIAPVEMKLLDRSHCVTGGCVGVASSYNGILREAQDDRRFQPAPAPALDL